MKKNVYLIVCMEALLQSIFFGFSATIMLHLTKSGVTVVHSMIIMNALRALFYSGIVGASFLGSFSFRAISVACVALMALTQIVVAHFGMMKVFFLICAAIFVLCAGISRSLIVTLAVNQVKSVKDREKVTTLLYILINLVTVFLEGSSPMVYQWFGGRVIYTVFAVFISAVLLLFLLLYGAYREPSKDKDVVYKFVKTFTLFVSGKSSKIPTGDRPLLSLMPFVFYVSIFYAVLDQVFSSGVAHTLKMNLFLKGFKMAPTHVQLINPLFVALFSSVLIRKTGSGSKLFRFTLGAVFCAIGFTMIGIIDIFNSHKQISALFDVVPYGILTLAEILVYTFAMEIGVLHMKEEFRGFGFAMFYLSGMIGNLFAILMEAGIGSLVGGINGKYFFLLAGISLFSIYVGYVFERRLKVGEN